MTEYCKYCGQNLAGGKRGERDTHIANCKIISDIRKQKRNASPPTNKLVGIRSKRTL